MKGYITDIEEATLNNEDYRRVLYTAQHLQLVLMCIQPGGEIGEETHHLDQFIRAEAGSGVIELNGTVHPLRAEQAVIIPAGTRHNVRNNGPEALKLYSIYAPPEHKDQVVQHTKADEFEEHYDGVTTE